MLYTLNLHSTVCQLYLNKTGRRRKTYQRMNVVSMKSICVLELWAEPASFSWNIIFMWRTTGKHWFFRLWYLAGIFSKINAMNLSLQGKQLTLLVTNDKNWAFKWKTRVLENHKLITFPVLKTFLLRPVKTLMNMISFYVTYVCVCVCVCVCIHTHIYMVCFVYLTIYYMSFHIGTYNSTSFLKIG